MQSSSSLNKQHIWGGSQFTPCSGGTGDTGWEETTVVGHGQHTKCFRGLPQGGIMASVSDDLFHPTSNVPSTNTFHLPNVPFNPNPHYNLHNHHGIPTYPLPHSSYHNPSFQSHLCHLTVYHIPLHLCLPIFLLIGWVLHH